MSEYSYYIGIDIGKNSFDVALHDGSNSANQFENTAQGIKKFMRTYQQKLPAAFVVLEATGGYENNLLKSLLKANSAVHRAHPLQAKHFIRSLGKRAKTDRLDALALARYGAERHQDLLLATERSESEEQFKTLLSRRDDLIAMRTQETNRFKSPAYASEKKHIKRVIDVLNDELKQLEIRMKAIISDSHELQKRKKVLLSMSGIGDTVANTLLGFLPELGKVTGKVIASLVGLAPHARDSGTLQGYRRTGGGRANIRKVLFLAALSASVHDKKLKEFYQRLLNKGKKPIVAIIAVARKLLVIANAKIRDLTLQTDCKASILAA